MESTHSNSLYQTRRKMLPTIIRDELTQRQRQIIVLRYVHKLSDREIGEKLGITVASVQRTRRRAEARIAHYLSYCG